VALGKKKKKILPNWELRVFTRRNIKLKGFWDEETKGVI
jgi:hypothetical protein